MRRMHGNEHVSSPLDVYSFRTQSAIAGMRLEIECKAQMWSVSGRVGTKGNAIAGRDACQLC